MAKNRNGLYIMSRWIKWLAFKIISFHIDIYIQTSPAFTLTDKFGDNLHHYQHTADANFFLLICNFSDILFNGVKIYIYGNDNTMLWQFEAGKYFTMISRPLVIFFIIIIICLFVLVSILCSNVLHGAIHPFNNLYK